VLRRQSAEQAGARSLPVISRLCRDVLSLPILMPMARFAAMRDILLFELLLLFTRYYYVELMRG